MTATAGVLLYKYSMEQENEMRKIMDKLKAPVSTDMLSEEFVAEVTNPNLEYQLVGSIVLTEGLTDEELDKQLNQISANMWADFDD